nr:MAG TPA: DNA REPAIR PROTEIN RAD52 HOMOLOG-BINDING PROTEIN, DNA REPAIR, DNA.7A [Caudoviricetes sp.]
MCKFRDLRADEIDVRVAMCKENGCSLLLYKDARCDMNILDETVGATNWQRQHTRDNANCIVSIWDEDKKQWISKEDTGTESMTEKEKGQASDSFKRACFNWGIGRELYTSPFIWIKSEDVKIIKRPNGTFATNDKFAVEKIKIENKKITALSIVNVTQKKRVFVMMPKEKGE